MKNNIKDDKNKRKEVKKSSNKNNGLNIVTNDGVYKERNYTMIFLIIGIICIIISVSIFAYKFFNGRGKYDTNAQYENKKKIFYDLGIDYSKEDYEKDQKAIEEAKKDKNLDVNSSNKDNQDENNSSSSNSVVDSSSTSSDNSTVTDSSNEYVSEYDNEDINYNIPEDSFVFDPDELDTSDAAKDAFKTNDNILDDIQEETQIDTTSVEVAQSIIDQTKEMNRYINGHVGYPSSEYNSEYDGVKAENDRIVKSFVTGEDVSNMYDESSDLIRSQFRYCIFEEFPYIPGNDISTYDKCIKNYMNIGHPVISSVDFITLHQLTDEEKEEYDSYLCNLKATIISNGVTYNVALASQVYNDGSGYFRILDIWK